MQGCYRTFTRVVCFSLLAGTYSFPQSGWIVVPVSQYEALRSKAYPPPADPEPAPVDATLTRIDYDLRLEGPLAAGCATLTVDVLRDAWVRIPIPGGLLVRSAKLDGKPVSLIPAAKPGDPPALALSRKGRATVVLEVAFPVSGSSGEERLALPTGASGVARAVVQGALVGTELRVTGGFASERSAPRWIAFARGHEPLIFTWRKQLESKRPELPLRARGSLTQSFALGEDSTLISAEGDLEAVQGALREVRLAIPDTVTVNNVAGATVADWELKDGTLTIALLDSNDRAVKFTLQAETRLARDGLLTLPLLRLLDLERESGFVAVEVTGAGEIKDLKPQGLERALPGEVNSPRASPSLTVFRLMPGARARALSVDVARYTQQALLTAIADEARYQALITADGKTLVEARYAVRNNQLNFLRVDLPANATLWSARQAGLTERAGQAQGQTLVIPLAKTREDAPITVVELLYQYPTPPWTRRGRATLTLPTTNVPVSRTGLLIHYPPNFRASLEPGGAFREQAFEPPGEAFRIPAPSGASASRTTANAASQNLIDQFRARRDLSLRTTPIAAPSAFPAIGPSIFLRADLSAESKSLTLDLAYEQQKGIR